MESYQYSNSRTSVLRRASPLTQPLAGSARTTALAGKMIATLKIQRKSLSRSSCGSLVSLSPSSPPPSPPSSASQPAFTSGTSRRRLGLVEPSPCSLHSQSFPTAAIYCSSLSNVLPCTISGPAGWASTDLVSTRHKSQTPHILSPS